MLRERYPVDKLFDEIAAHFPAMDPILAKIDGYLEDEAAVSVDQRRSIQTAAENVGNGKEFDAGGSGTADVGGEAAVPIQLCRNGAVCQ